MIRLSLSSVTVAGLLACMLTSVAEGQTIPSRYRFIETKQEVEVFVGVTGQGTGQFGYGPGPGPAFGARYGVRIGGPFGMEAALAYSPTTRDLVDPTREEGSRVVGEADANLLSIDARLRFSLTGDRTWRNLNPFLFLGIGVIWDAAGKSEDEGLVLPEDQFKLGRRMVAPVGGGIRWFLGDRLFARADVALTLFKLKTPRGYRNAELGLENIGEKEWVGGPTFSLGLGFRF